MLQQATLSSHAVDRDPLQTHRSDEPLGCALQLVRGACHLPPNLQLVLPGKCRGAHLTTPCCCGADLENQNSGENGQTTAKLGGAAVKGRLSQSVADTSRGLKVLNKSVSLLRALPGQANMLPSSDNAVCLSIELVALPRLSALTCRFLLLCRAYRSCSLTLVRVSAGASEFVTGTQNPGTPWAGGGAASMCT